MPAKLRVLLVDDERLARVEMRSLLNRYAHIDVVGEAESVDSALGAIEALNPDLIFLDIQMPGASGFELLDRISVQANIIFVTAFDAYAIRAFEVNALDYLLKPVSPERLDQALGRLKQAPSAPQDPLRRLESGDRLFLSLDNQMRFLEINQIIAISALGDYTELCCLDGKKYLTPKPLKIWEARLPEKDFIRIHRSTIIHMGHVNRLESWFNAAFRVHMKGIEVPFIMSRRYASRIKQKLG